MNRVQYSLVNRSAHIRFHVPPVNALPSDVLSELEQAFRRAAADPDAKSIVLESEGRTFCAGASFDELIRLQDPREAVAFFGGFGRVMLAMKSAPKPVIARIQGKTVGGGVGLVAAADLALAVEEAAFKLSEISIGIGPFVISPAIRRKGGTALLQKMSWQPHRWFSAFDLKKDGLIDHVFENRSALDEYLEELTAGYARYDARAMARWKETLWTGTENWPQLFEQLAEKSAALLLRDSVKNYLQQLKSK